MSTLEFSQLLGNYGEFVGAIAIVVTLIYLAVQLKQNTASVRASAYQTWTSAMSDHLGAAQVNDTMSQVIVTGLDDPGSLTADTWVQFSSWCHRFVLIAETTYYLHKEEIIADSVYSKELERAARLVSGSGGGAQWWTAGAKTQFSEEFVAVVESMFEQKTSFRRYDFTEGVGFHVAKP
jgi:hypothetical protein